MVDEHCMSTLWVFKILGDGNLSQFIKEKMENVPIYTTVRPWCNFKTALPCNQALTEGIV